MYTPYSLREKKYKMNAHQRIINISVTYALLIVIYLLTNTIDGRKLSKYKENISLLTSWKWPHPNFCRRCNQKHVHP